MYQLGKGIPQNVAEAMKWYRRAAEKGDSQALYNVGNLYAEGESVPHDEVEAFKWFHRAAETNDGPRACTEYRPGRCLAQYEVGFAYFIGRGVPKNYSEAAKWFRRAATDWCSPFAQLLLGQMHERGWGVPQDYAEAAHWYRGAASLDTDAKFNLGVLYAQGRGVPQDYVSAYMWVSLAAEEFTLPERHEKFVRARDQIANLMTSSQLDEARQHAREWTPSKRCESNVTQSVLDKWGHTIGDALWPSRNK
jgi:TPR repeat protein